MYFFANSDLVGVGNAAHHDTKQQESILSLGLKNVEGVYIFLQDLHLGVLDFRSLTLASPQMSLLQSLLLTVR